MCRWHTQQFKDAELLASTGSTGDSYDNAMAESLNGLYKAEVIHCKSWKNRAEVELATLTCVDWYNNRRLLERLGNIPPSEAEKEYYASSEMVIWQPEFTDKILSRKTGAVHIGEEATGISIKVTRNTLLLVTQPVYHRRHEVYRNRKSKSVDTVVICKQVEHEGLNIILSVITASIRTR